MSLREKLTDWSKGDGLGWFWRLYWLRKKVKSRAARDILTFLLNRSAHRHGGYVGPGADIQGEPVLPHGLHGVFISRYAVIGANCRIYQNVTIGEVDRKAPVVGNGCWIGAGGGVSFTHPSDVADISLQNSGGVGFL
ncbi:serine acetyltransferase [Intestinimonas massiliensis (ex Afouda et al. 2020)]|uniref:serine acetyltransferase n=1 Tax=Intestinimonas massiliensis (ex Afouda et al. 2020) TaxID=1673721 RepID=UPI001A922225|nr:serine acetyltransferase [Intestinimonas massiliensis (ex Afouda et al. 2020)]